MFQRRIPESLRHAQTPSVKNFAVLAAVESVARGILTSVFPIAMYQTFLNAETVSEIYFAIGVLSLAVGLLVPWLTRFIPRSWLYCSAIVVMLLGNILAIKGGTWSITYALMAITLGTVVITICFNAYIMDYIERVKLGECETLRLFYSGAAWTVGPFLGVWLMEIWTPAPFAISGLACIVLLIVFIRLHLGDGKVINKAESATLSPLAYLPLFFKQPRLISGWLFAVIRSCAWWVYVVYLPIFAVKNGFSEHVGGLALSITNGLLFTTPLMLRWMKGRVRFAVRLGFFASGIMFTLAYIFSYFPHVAIALLMLGSGFLIWLDICAGLPFLMAVKPSQRTEMSTVYSTYRDVSGVVTPGLAKLVLLAAPLPAVFAAMGLGLFAALLLANQLHYRLGIKRTPYSMT